jgi:hypothetical protein
MARINVRKYYRENKRLLMNLTAELRKKLNIFFSRQKSKAFSEYSKNSAISEQYYFNFYKGLYKILVTHSRKVESAVSELNKRIRKKQDDFMNDDYREEVLASKVTKVTETTKKKIAGVISLALKEGLDINTIAEAIRNSTVFGLARSRTIARTETSNAMNEYHYRNALQSSLKNPKKMWLSSQDERSREWHRVMNRRMVEMNEDFTVITPTKAGPIEFKMNVPGDERGGPSNVINCRCSVLFIDEDDLLLDND